MFKKLRDKITEEVQQTSLKLPVSVQQLSQLSPFSGSGGDLSEPSRSPQNSLQDELLVNISDIQPAGDNKNLFSIDEESSEGTPSKSGKFQLVELDDENGSSPCTPQKVHSNELGSHSAFDPSSPNSLNPPPIRRRKSSDGSNASELFPIYEVPNASFNLPQSDLESCSSEWEDGGTSGLDRLSKDTVYQAYLRTRQRYHKYKGRYADVARAYQDKERETDKLRDVLAKQQDQSVRRISELREQCSLEQQAKAHLEEELRNDLEEKDHKIDTLQTKIQILQENITNEFQNPEIKIERNDKTEDEVTNSQPPSLYSNDESQLGSNKFDDHSDNVSVGSLGSISTAPTSLESEELIDRLKGDLAKHKMLLGRCMDNIKINKDKMTLLKQEKDSVSEELLQKIKYIELLKIDHEKELDSLRASVESSALSMAETKKQMFEEMQSKEVEVEHFRVQSFEMSQTIKKLEQQLEELKSQSDEELEINFDRGLEDIKEEEEEDMKSIQSKCSELENIIADLQSSKKDLEAKLEKLTASSILSTSNSELINEEVLKQHQEQISSLSKAKITLETQVQFLTEELQNHEEETKRLKEEKNSLNNQLKSSLENVNAVSLEKTKVLQDLASISDEKCDISKRFEKLTKDYKEMEMQLTSVDEEKITLNEKINSLSSETSHLTNELSSLTVKFNELNKDKEIVDEKLVNLNSDFSSLEAENVKFKAEIADQLRIIESNHKEIVVLNENLKKSQTQLKLLESQKNDLELQLEGQSSDKDNYLTSIQSKLKEYELKSSEFEKTEMENEATKSALKNTCDKLSETEVLNAQLTDKIKELEESILSKNQLVKDLENKYKNIETLYTESNCSVTSMKEALEKELGIKGNPSDAVKTFIEQKMELEKELEKVNLEHKNIVHERDKISEKLDAECKIKENLKLEKSKLLKEKEEHFEEHQKMNKEIEELIANREKLKEEFDQFKTQHENMNNDFNNRIQQLQDEVCVKIETISTLEKSLQGNTKQLEALEKTTESRNQELEAKEIVIKNLKFSIGGTKTSLEKAKNSLQEKNDTISKLEKQLEEISKSNQNLNFQITKMSKESETLKKEIKTKENLLSTLELEVKEKENALKKIKIKLDDYQDKINEELQRSKEKSSEVCAKIAIEKDKEIENLAKELEEKKSKLDYLDNDVETLKNAKDQLSVKVESLLKETKNLESLETQMKQIKEQKIELESKISEIDESNRLLQSANDLLKQEETKSKENLSKFEKKILSMLEEKKQILSDFESQVAERETQIEELSAKLSQSEMIETKNKELKETIDKLSLEKTTLQEKTIVLDSLVADKDRLQNLLSEKEKMILHLEECHENKFKNIEQTWQNKLSCELEKLQAEHDHKLAEAVGVQDSKWSQLSDERESLRHSLARKDAELARLQDTCDSVSMELEERAAMDNQNDQIKQELQTKIDEQQNEIKLLQEKLTLTEQQMATQVLNMELSNNDLRQKIDSLQSELSSLENQIKVESSSVEDRLAVEKSNLEKVYQQQLASLSEKVETLTQIDKSKAKQISEIEASTGALHSKLSEVQTQRDQLEKKVTQDLQKWLQLETELEKLVANEDAALLKKTDNVSLKIKSLHVDKTEAQNELSKVREEHKKSQEEVVGLKNQSNQLAMEIKNLQEQLSSNSQSKDSLTQELLSLRESKNALESTVSSLTSQLSDEQRKLSVLEEDSKNLKTAIEKIPNLQLTSSSSSDVESVLKSLLNERDDAKNKLLEITKSNDDIKTQLADCQKSLGDKQMKISKLNSKLQISEQNLTAAKLEIGSAIKATKASELRGEAKMKSESDIARAVEECKKELHAEYLTKLNQMESDYKNKENIYKDESSALINSKEREMQLKLDQLTQEWTKERKELERLTQVATAAFKSGTDSVDLLRKQVNSQRKELEDAKMNHRKEIGELQALLEVKRRRSKGGGDVKIGGSLEDAAEFEYLKNILFQYMVGKETETLSKVLGAIVKFSKEELHSIALCEEKKQNIERENAQKESEQNNPEKSV